VLVTTLTKRMAEDLATYIRDAKVRVEYLHSDIDALERVEILRRLRAGEFDVLVGVNLLREGLDLPEVALVAILDADKEGFLRSETSLIQTSGRAARHEQGRVLLYADVMTESLKRALAVSRYRRERQMAYNTAHGITPRGITRGMQSSLHIYADATPDPVSVAEAHGDREVAAVLAELEQEMLDAAGKLEFERAAILRDQIEALKAGYAGKPPPRRAGGEVRYRQKRKKG
jgi:excinuclease ABC subunit B